MLIFILVSQFDYQSQPSVIKSFRYSKEFFSMDKNLNSNKKHHERESFFSCLPFTTEISNFSQKKKRTKDRIRFLKRFIFQAFRRVTFLD